MLERIAKDSKGIIVYSKYINLLFPNFRGKREKIVAIGPHDDDPFIGAALLLYELRNLGTEVYVVIMTDGRKGYCKKKQKKYIVEIRKRETENAYSLIGIDKEYIKRFELPDSDLWKEAFKWENHEGKDDGLIAQLIKYFREVGATRFLLPNDNDFHLDHQATFHSALYSLIQASEKIVPDFKGKSRRDSILRYGVWSPFDGNPTHAIKTSQDTLDRKLEGLSSFKSQKQIEEIKNNIRNRGPYEFFQEFVVKSFPIEEYKKMFSGIE